MGLVMKKWIVRLALGFSVNIDAQSFEWYVAKAVPGSVMSRAQAEEIFDTLLENDAGDFNNIAIMEYLSENNISVSYADLLKMNINSKNRQLIGYLNPDVTDILDEIRIKTGLSEESIHKRLLNNLSILEGLLLILGQSYDDTVNSPLFDKQDIFKEFGTTNKLLQFLLKKGYTHSQLVAAINLSHETTSLNNQSKASQNILPITNALLIKFDGDSDSESFDELDIFSSEELEHYLDLIKEIDTATYDDLISCGEIASYCLQKLSAGEGFVDKYLDMHPTMFIPTLIHLPSVTQKQLLQPLAKLYHEAFQEYEHSIDPAVRMRVLELINKIAPDLYDIIISVDPEGKVHIVRDVGTAVNCKKSDGYPIFYIEDDFANWSEQTQEFTIAHELSHYVLEHNLKSNDPDMLNLRHKKLDNSSEKENNFLEYRETFLNSYDRQMEYEADRYAILQFKAPTLGAIELFGSNKTDLKDPIMATFNSTHPINERRIDHLLGLERDLQTYRSVKIDWQRLIDMYSTPGMC